MTTQQDKGSGSMHSSGQKSKQPGSLRVGLQCSVWRIPATKITSEWDIQKHLCRRAACKFLSTDQSTDMSSARRTATSSSSRLPVEPKSSVSPGLMYPGDTGSRGTSGGSYSTSGCWGAASCVPEGREHGQWHTLTDTREHFSKPVTVMGRVSEGPVR